MTSHRSAGRALGALAVLYALAAAQALARDPVIVIEIRGTIHARLVDTVHAALEKVDRDRRPAGALVLIDSPGGDGLAAIEIGRLLRKARAHVFVRGKCASACLFVFAGGEVRAAPEHAVGIHQPRITRWVREVGAVRVNPSDHPKAALALEEGNRQAREFLDEMGLPPALYEAMMQVPPERTRYLARDELAAFGLLSAEARGAAAIRTQENCGPDMHSPAGFARCYRRTFEAFMPDASPAPGSAARRR